jgi:L-histidine N-alpha-methyltransferase
VRSRWLWDERGSALFEAITALPEYYLTRREQEILAQRAVEIARLCPAETVIELGSGSAVKTTLLLDAIGPQGGLLRYAALDVSEDALRLGLSRLSRRYAGLELTGFVADFERQLDQVRLPGRRLVVFLGSTIGALEPQERAPILGQVAAALEEGDALLLGADLVKPAERILAAYTDAGGLSAALIANLLPVLNRELGAGFEVDRFASQAWWEPELERMEMAVRSLGDQVVEIPSLHLAVAFRDGELLHTEISTKFRREGLQGELAAAGLHLAAWWTDEADEYAVCLARPA